MPPQRPDAATRAEAAAYVATLAGDLARIARRNALPTLAYLLEIARLEGETRAQEAAQRLAERPRPA